MIGLGYEASHCLQGGGQGYQDSVPSVEEERPSYTGAAFAASVGIASSVASASAAFAVVVVGVVVANVAELDTFVGAAVVAVDGHSAAQFFVATICLGLWDSVPPSSFFVGFVVRPEFFFFILCLVMVRLAWLLYSQEEQLRS